MELNIEAFLDEELDSLRNMFSHEDPDFMLQTNEYDANLFLQTFWPVNEGNENIMAICDGNSQSFDNLDYINFHNVSEESSNNFLNHLEQVFGGSCQQNSNFHEVPIINGQFGNVHGQQLNIIVDSNDEHLMKRKWDAPTIHQAEYDENSLSVSPENPTKKSRVSRNASKGKRNVGQSKPKLSKMGGKENNNVDKDEMANVVKKTGHGPGSYSSEDDLCNVLEDSNIGGETSDNKGHALMKLNGKAKTSRVSATDAQSVYARRRREKINERLRILQNLIPNGTKVDISTMLEEAVHYVKFLQLQIKLLSSEDMWMYAPIVYNGLDMGLLGKNFPI